MAKVQILRGMPPRRTAAAWRYMEELGRYVDPQTGAVTEHPDQTAVRRESLERLRNPAPTYPTLSPEAMRRVRHDLQAGRQTSHEPDGPSAA